MSISGHYLAAAASLTTSFADRKARFIVTGPSGPTVHQGISQGARRGPPRRLRSRRIIPGPVGPPPSQLPGPVGILSQYQAAFSVTTTSFVNRKTRFIVSASSLPGGTPGIATAEWAAGNNDPAKWANFEWAAVGQISWFPKVKETLRFSDFSTRGKLALVLDTVNFSDITSTPGRYVRNLVETILTTETFSVPGVAFSQLFRAKRRVFTFVEQLRGKRSGL